jgi:hypothetical protein
VGREQSGVMPIRAGETGGRVMDLVAADPRGVVAQLDVLFLVHGHFCNFSNAQHWE